MRYWIGCIGVYTSADYIRPQVNYGIPVCTKDMMSCQFSNQGTACPVVVQCIVATCSWSSVGWAGLSVHIRVQEYYHS